MQLLAFHKTETLLNLFIQYYASPLQKFIVYGAEIIKYTFETWRNKLHFEKEKKRQRELKSLL